jgi:hypothetical protein
MISPRTHRTMIPGPTLPDFDTLHALHREDPEAFEHFRTKVLREALDSAPPRHHPALEKLLCSIEHRREAASTPMEALIAASRAMQDSVEQLVNGWAQTRVAAAEWQAAVIIERVRR